LTRTYQLKKPEHAMKTFRMLQLCSDKAQVEELLERKFWDASDSTGDIRLQAKQAQRLHPSKGLRAR
jgi:hypothetical protein